MKNLFKYLFCLSVLITMPVSIFAQESEGIEEVIVTATKRESNVQDIPMVVDVFTNSQIEDLNIKSTEDLGYYVPSLTVAYNADPMNARMSIRGLGTSQSDAALESDVSLVVDGVYLNKTGLGLTDLVDIERIEVLQGPQGTLYGKNSNAGVVSITTKKPTPGDSDAFVRYENGDYGTTVVTSAFTLGLSDNLALRFSGQSRESEGYMLNSVDGSYANGDNNETYSLRLYFESDDLNVLFNHTDILKVSSCCALDSIDTSPFVATANVMGGLGTLGPYAPADGEYNNYMFQATPGLPDVELDSQLTSIRVDKERKNGILTYVVARNTYSLDRVWDADFTAGDFWTLHRVLPGESLTHELRFSSNMMNNYQYTIGAYMSESEYGEYGGGIAKRAITVGDEMIPIWTSLLNTITAQITPLATAAAMGTASQTQLATLNALSTQATGIAGLVGTTQAGDGIAQDMMWDDSTTAIFGRVTRQLTDTLRVTAGIRYTSEEKEADLYARTVLDGLMVVSPTLANAINQPALAGASVPRQALLETRSFLNGVLQPVDKVFMRSDSATTWSLSLEKDISDEIMIYALAATGYKAGGFNSTSGDDNTARAFDKSETESFEIGIKSRLLDNKVQINATIFNSETDGQTYIAQDSSGGGTIVGNASVPAERLGFDMNVIAKLRPNLTLNATYMTIDDNDPPYLSFASARLTPNDAYTVGLTHMYPFSGGMLFTRLDYSYDGPYEWSSALLGTPAFPPVPGRPEVYEERDQKNINAKVGWRNDSWEIAYSVKNASDEANVRLALQPSPVSGVNGFSMFPPKISTFSIKYSF